MDSNKTLVLETMKQFGIQAVNALEADAPKMDGTQLVDQEQYIPDFDPDKHQYLNWTIGQAVRDEGQVWKLIQPYDSNIYKDHPNNLRAHWGLMHTKDPYKAKPYVEPLGTSGMYMKDECCTEGGKIYISTIDNNVWTPTAYPSGWKEYK